MTDFASVLEGVVSDLAAAGLNASEDAADVNPPGVLVRIESRTENTGKLCGTETLRIGLLLIVPDTGTRAATRELARLASRVGPAAKIAGLRLLPDDQTFERVTMPDDPTGLPCLRIPTLITYAPDIPLPLFDRDPVSATR
jgi:hypothetical protein